jgi:hypothetical protein
MVRVLCGALVFCLLAAGAGCGGGPSKPKQYPVSGKVMVDGKPLANVGIYFIASTGAQNFSGTTGSDGSYSLSDPQDKSGGAQPGKYKIVLQLVGEDLSKGMMQAMQAPGQGGPPKVTTPFPTEYTAATTSPKEVEVKAESNTIDITIP